MSKTKKSTKLTDKDKAQILINEGTVRKVIGFTNPSYIVESHGHTYQIDNAFTHPKIKQLS